ncbi:MAG: PVC-type heme-binding CxxCH protein [Gemmataceae bacterium]
MPRCLALLLAVLGSVAVIAQGFRPEAAVGKMVVPPGMEVSLVASEPAVRQPVAIDFDDRGRLWVMQYLQYPNPAGLKRARVDRYSRTVYDRVPEPPPHGPKGADRLTIVTGTDGKAARPRDFVAGLNLASGFAFGHGGVFVLQVPYLLFYPDRDGDDVPDDDPEVLLTGFGMEDAHSVANSLTWGPDGWLYGCQGSTVTANIRGIEFQQGVWRYHPLTRRFELFCEGGGNSWGLDFDQHGHLLYSTNHGGHVLLHGVQGGYYWKAFGKHGPLHNPYTYGYFEHASHQGFKGGHVTVGGFVYQGDSFPASYRNRYMGADLLGHSAYWHDILPVGSTFRTRHAGDLLVSNDTWFAPSDITMGPDGAVYVADWHDQRTAHPDPDAEWDRSNGRIYRIAAKGTRPYDLGDLRKVPSARLVELLSHRNDWVVRRARRILADRRDPEVILPLRRLVRTTSDSQLALEALWALYVSGGFSDAVASDLLTSNNPHLRRWTVRLLGDAERLSAAQAPRLAALAATESDAQVRSQLASTARRLPVEQGLPIVAGLLRHAGDIEDPHIPLLLWWAVEPHAVRAIDRVVALFTTETGNTLLARAAVLPRLMRRLASAGTPTALDGCAKLLATGVDSGPLLAALHEGLRDRREAIREVPTSLGHWLGSRWKETTTDPVLIRVVARLGRAEGVQRAVALAGDNRQEAKLRVEMVQLLGETAGRDHTRLLLKLFDDAPVEAVKRAACDALLRQESPEVGAELMARYPRLKGTLRDQVRGGLLSRVAWAKLFVTAVDKKQVEAREVSAEELQSLAQLGDRDLDARVRAVWGSIQPPTAEEKLAVVRRLNNDLRAAAGQAQAGKVLFGKLCANCHQLHGEGGAVGPDLTHANRKDRQFLLVSLVDPSAVIRKEYLSWTVQTSDGRVRTGIIVAEKAGTITLVDATRQRVDIPRSQIEKVEQSAVSLMPDNLLRDLKPQELRDLFAYLQR